MVYLRSSVVATESTTQGSSLCTGLVMSLEQIVSLGNFKLIMMNILAKLIGPQRCSPQNPHFFFIPSNRATKIARPDGV